MFIGQYRHTVDEKGRLALPAKFRKLLGSGSVVTRGIDNCLFLYPQKAWQQVAQRLAKLPFNQANSRAFSRSMLAGAMEVGCDAQGRILIPEYLRKFANLDKKVVVAGVYDRLELWDQASWLKYTRLTEKSGSEIAEQVDFGG